MKTDFIQQISHEIRTPLNILSGFTQIITTPGVKLDDATRAEANEKITENTDRITSLVNKMLELAETNSKVVIEMNDHVTLGEIVAGAVGESGIEDVAGVRFVLQLNADLATKEIVTNAQALQRALAQLLDNAGKFRKADAYNTVTFAVGIIASRLSFSVEDTGIGVPPEQSEHIFEEFVQLDKYKVGTGIGLTIARSLARRMGGDIVLDTAYTAGARFVLMLPLK
jgi:signal transduction histidine kinase